MTKLDTIFKSRDNKGLYSQSCGFSSSRVWMWELDHKGGWALKNWCFWTVVLEKTLWESLYNKEIKQVNPKGNQPWIFLGGLMLKLKLQCFGHLMSRAGSLEKTWCLERLKAEGEGDYRGWDCQKASPIQSTSLSKLWDWQWTGKPGMLQPMGSQRVEHDLLNWTEFLIWLHLEIEALGNKIKWSH